MLISGMRGLKFKSRAGQIGQNVANGSPPLQHFSKGAVLRGCNDVEVDGSTTFRRQYSVLFD